MGNAHPISTLLAMLVISLTICLEANAQFPDPNRALVNTSNAQIPDSMIGPECRTVNGFKEGFCRTFYKDGKVRTEGIYTKGGISGHYKVWRTDSTLAEEWALDAENQNGRVMYYWLSGIVKEQVVLEDNQIVDRKLWYEDGTLEMHEVLIKDATFHATVYRSDGTVLSSGNMMNGCKNGEWLTFDEQGHEIERSKYQQGELVP